MGLTISDRNQQMYHYYISRGYSHEQAIKEFPEHKRKQVELDANKSPFESHFGISPIWFFIFLLTVIVGSIIFALNI